MITVVVINYRQTAITLECLASLYTDAGHPFELLLVDNAEDETSRRLLEGFALERTNVTLISNADNKGFAGGCNQAIETILDDPSLQAVALLNNDTIVGPDWLARMVAKLDSSKCIDMVAGRMMAFEDPTQVDSLGIVFYKSGIASNRKRIDQPLLGPCGGAALYSARLLRQLRDRDGYLFDPEFFCYAEDTDLALRARALGYGCAFADEATVRHRAGHSSGGGYNEFIAYQGLRNSLFALIKNLPTDFFLTNAFWLTAMQGAIILKYLIKGKPALLWRIYRDVIRGLPRVLHQRRSLGTEMKTRTTPWKDFCSLDFYDRAYLRAGLRTLHKRDIRPARH